MQTTFALAALAAVAYAQGVTESIAPQASAPAGCSPSYSGSFQIQAVNYTETPSKAKRDSSCGSEGTLTLTLANGILLDAQGRTGYIASNYQFQFDKPPQAGAIYTAGFSTCGNGSLALGGSAVWYQCYSGGFYNLYDRNWAAQCSSILLEILPCSGSVSQISDGQIQATSAVAPVSEMSEGQVQATSVVAPVSQISDGQVQATSAVAPISQISDGQVQATSAVAPISQISDGQVQATSAVAPVSEKSEGQVQVTSAVAPPPASTVTPVNTSVASPPASTVIPVTTSVAPTNATSSLEPFTGSASNLKTGLSALVMAAVAVAFL